MSLAKEILEVLGRERFFTELLLVPGTEPKKRTPEGLVPALEKTLTPDDTRGLLIYFRELAGKVGPLRKREVFTFSYEGLGRVRVVYGLQRGSYYLTLLKVPFEVPEPSDFLKDPLKFERFYAAVTSAKGYTFAVFGEDWFVNATFVFAVFRRLTEEGKKLVLTVENPPAYLLRHGRGAALQKELFVDDPSLEEALRDLPLIGPDFAYVFDALNLYTLPLEEIFRYLPPGTNLFLNFPLRSELLLRNFLAGRLKSFDRVLGVRLFETPAGLFDFSVVHL